MIHSVRRGTTLPPGLVLGLGLVLGVLPGGARADGLDDLKAGLAALDALQPVRAAIRATVRMETDEDGDAKATSGVAELTARLDGGGLTLSYPAAMLERLRAEQIERGNLTEQTSTELGLSELDVARVTSMVAPADELARRLERATLVAERPVTRGGRQLRLVELRLEPAFSPEDRKRLKKFEDTLKLWIDEHGRPVAGEESVSMLFKAMLLKFTNDLDRSWEFDLADGRLVATAYRETTEVGALGERVKTSVEIELGVLSTASPAQE
jgi:hypothetical protein